MKIIETSCIRNVVVAGHSGSGKTTLSEAMLFTAGAVSRFGKVSDGTSALDHTPDETRRHTGVYLGLAQFEFGGKKINLLDSPGYADFIGEVYAGLKAADFGLIVLSATAGVESDTERHFEMMNETEMPRFLAINAMDKEQADFGKVMAQVTERLSDRAVPLYLPIGSGAEFKGVVDVLTEKAYLWGAGKEPSEAPIPAELQSLASEMHGKIVELAAESDDQLLEKFLETLELSPEETLQGLRRGIATGKIYPVLPVSGERNLGVGFVLKTIAELGPNPLETPGPMLKSPTGEPSRLTCGREGPLAALIFKVTSELMAQEIGLIRVYSGSLVSGSDVYNSTKETTERVGQLYHFLGKDRSDTETLVAGDIGAAAKLKSAVLNDTLCAKEKRLVLSPIAFPRPVHEIAVASKHKGDEEKVGTAFNKLHEEDPTFQIDHQGSLHQTVLRAMGDQHVDVIVDRLKRKFGVEVEVSKPRVPFRETIRGTADVSHRHKKQTGGRGQFADVSIKVEPLPRGGGFEFENEIVGGVIPSKFIPAVEKGVRESMDEGPLAGYPVVDFRVRLHYGGYHDVDSSEMAFKIAGSMALRKGLEESRPVLLEPIMLVQVTVPDEYMGDVMGDLSSRRGKIQGMEQDGRVQRIKAAVPQVELYRYSTTLRSLTQGRARYTAEFSHYEEVPRDAAERLVEELKKEKQTAV